MRDYEVIPEKPEEIATLLKKLYPWRDDWDQMALSQIFPSEVLGKRVTAISDNYLEPLRHGIAHSLLEEGEITVILDNMEHVQAVSKWLPLCRICARWMLLNDFPDQFTAGKKNQ